MKYNLLYDKKAKDSLLSPDKKIRDQVLKKIEKLRENPFLGKPILRRFGGFRRLRVEKYRVLYSVKEKNILIVRVKHREKVYR